MISPERKKQFALIGVSMAAALNALDFAIVNTALPAIQRDLTATLVQLQWIMNIFILVRTVFTVTLGRVADIFGRRLMLYVGVIAFGFGSIMGAISPNAGWLIFARVVQGASAALMSAPTILPSSVFAKPAPSDRVVVGSVGTGDLGCRVAVLRRKVGTKRVQPIVLRYFDKLEGSNKVSGWRTHFQFGNQFY